jgi:undecaprenyl pyrophosphate phosphatase UppP
MAVAAVTGYVAIAALLWVIRKAGLAPFGIYCILFATMSFFLVG